MDSNLINKIVLYCGLLACGATIGQLLGESALPIWWDLLIIVGCSVYPIVSWNDLRIDN